MQRYGSTLLPSAKNKPAVGYASTPAFTPAAPSTPPKTPSLKPPLANDSIYNAAADLAERKREEATNEFQYGLGTAGVQYGLKADPNTYSVSEMDPTSPDYNPFNQMALLRKHFENTKRGNTNRYAASGQLYSGALQNAQDDTVNDYQQGYGQLTSSFADLIHGLLSSRTAANDSADSDLAAAGADEIGRRQASPFAVSPTPTATQTAPVVGGYVAPSAVQAQSSQIMQALQAAERRPASQSPTLAQALAALPYTLSLIGGNVVHTYPDGRKVEVKK